MRPKQQLKKAEGTIDEAQWLLVSHPGRYDWYRPTVDDERPPLDHVIEPLLRVMERWIESSPPLYRLAFGAILLQPVGDKKEGYEQLGQYLPSVKLDGNASDFLLQINRPRLSETDSSVTVHRLSRWSFVALTRSAVTGSGPHMEIRELEPERHFCKLELDINTSTGGQRELPKSLLRELGRELVDLGREIAEAGDIP